MDDQKTKFLNENKEKALEVFGDKSSTSFQMANALLYLIYVDYEYAKEYLESMPKSIQRRIHGKRYQRGYKLCIDVYTRHWLHANGHTIDPAILKSIKENWSYKPEPSTFLPKGHAIYEIPFKPKSGTP